MDHHHRAARADGVQQGATEARPYVAAQAREVVLEVDGVGDGGVLRDARLSVRGGEVEGLAGAEPAPGSVYAAQRAGVAYVPGDRRHEGTVAGMSIHDSVVLAWLRGRSRLGITISIDLG